MAAPVVVGVDGSSPAEQALLWAAAEAALRHCPLVIAHACAARVEARDLAGEVVREAASIVVEAGIDCGIDLIVRDEPPGRALQTLGLDAQLLVIGAHGAGRVAGTLLGSVPRVLAAHASCPVVVVPETWSRELIDPGRVVAVGLTVETARETAQFACDEALLRGQRLLAVCSLPRGDDGLSAEQVQARIETIRTEHPDLAAEVYISGLSVYDALYSASTRADLLVLGAARSASTTLSVATAQLLHQSRCPVAVVGHD